MQKIIHILVDTREQRPWLFKGMHCKVEKKTLQTGDYSIKGLAGILAIERKSIDDLVASVTRCRQRFERECQRLKNMPFRLVIIEGTVRQVLSGFYTSKSNPQSILGSVMALMLDYDLPFIFTAGRDEAQLVAWRWFLNARRRAE